MQYKTEFRFWTTPKAHALTAEVAESKGLHRSVYICQLLHEALTKDLGDVGEFDQLFSCTANRLRNPTHNKSLALGHGRWAKWVQGRLAVSGLVPMMLTKAAEQTGDGSASAYIRRVVAEALFEETGQKVPLPNNIHKSPVFGRSA